MRTTDDDAYFARGRPLMADPGTVNMLPAIGKVAAIGSSAGGGRSARFAIWCAKTGAAERITSFLRTYGG